VLEVEAGRTDLSEDRRRSLLSRSLAETTASALADAGADAEEVEAVFFGNAAASLLSRQGKLRGQFLLQGTGLEGTPIVNVENACASSTAARLAWRAVVAGEVTVAVGAEKMDQPDRERQFRALAGALDIERTRSLRPWSREEQ
jgi:acetyl-CoA acetyltransferase